MKFTPVIFQTSVAAGGVALMPFVYLQFAEPRWGKPVMLFDIPWSELTIAQNIHFFPLVGIMLVFTVTHLLFTLVFLKSLVMWLANKEEYNTFINDPKINIGVFSPIASLSMTANVIWGPLAFFLPQLSSILQSLMLPSLLFFGALWLIILKLEFKVLKIWLTNPVDTGKLNFTWLLDVFAFGLVCLTGSGIAATAINSEIASIAAFGTLFALGIGIFLFVTKLSYLVYLQIKSSKLPDIPLLPAYFMVIPIICLFGVGFYRLMLYLQKYFAINVDSSLFLSINLSYVTAVSWGIFCIYLLSDYLRKDFMKSKFSPTKWGII
jgi:hypothetical protein